MKNATREQKARAGRLFDREIEALQRSTDKVFGSLLAGQWVAAIACALWVSPLTWNGGSASLHTHVVAALGIGGLLTLFPLWLIRKAPGHAVTRYAAVTAQMLFSALFIHLMGGRIEAHFHVFGSLALLAFYRDYRVFVPAIGVTFLDHVLRGVFWPESVFGVITPSILRAFEHAGWVVFESGFLMWGVAQSRQHLRNLALVQAILAEERDSLELRVEQRTHELAETRDYFSNVINSLDAHLCILDAKGSILTTNRAWQVFGAQRGIGGAECGEGTNYLEVCRDSRVPCCDSACDLADAIEAVIRGEREGAVIEYECHEAGRERWFQARVSPFLGDSEASAVVSHVEVTERVEESNKALALAQIITESPDEVYIFNRDDLHFEMVNDGAVAATGYQREELHKMTPVDLKKDFDEPLFRKKIAGLAEGLCDVFEFQTDHTRKDGSAYPVQVSLHPAVYNGIPVYVAFVTDISELRRLEGRLAQAQKLESLGQLSAGIAHEINTPMQCVSNNVQFLSECHERLFSVIDELVEQLNSTATPWAERRERIEALIDQAQYDRISSNAPDAISDAAEASRRVVEIVRAMQSMSHPGSSDASPADLNGLIRSAATISQNRWKYFAELDLDLDTAAPAIPCHAAELSQVFLNLIVNAADAIHEKAGEGGPLGRIEVRTRAEADGLRIEVEDNGAGVPKAIRDKLFDPFFTTKEVGKGTGQGLSIAYDVVANRHGGSIEIDSTEGVGTTFIVRLPSAQAGSTAGLEAAASTV